MGREGVRGGGGSKGGEGVREGEKEREGGGTPPALSSDGGLGCGVGRGGV